jgi:hypothetical protein
VGDPAAEDGVLDLEGELARRPHAAVGGERAAEHERVLWQVAIAGMAGEQGARIIIAATLPSW